MKNEKATPIKRKTLTGAVTEALRDRILKGEFADGEQLRQEALSREFGVSRVPLREALRQLEAEGLIKILPHKGAVVTQLSFDDIVEILHIRALIECDLLKQAIPLQSAQDHDEAQRTLDQFAEALATGDVQHWGTMNARFHLALYRSAERPHTIELIESLHRKTERYIRVQILLTEYTEKAHQEHQALLDLCRSGDAEQAAVFLRGHIMGASEALRTYLAAH